MIPLPGCNYRRGARSRGGSPTSVSFFPLYTSYETPAATLLQQQQQQQWLLLYIHDTPVHTRTSSTNALHSPMLPSQLLL